jgi:hypothetical protein
VNNPRSRPLLVSIVAGTALVAVVGGGLLVARLRRPPVREVADGEQAPEAAAGFSRRRRPVPPRMALASPSPDESSAPASRSTLPEPGADPVQGARAALDGVLAELKGSGEARGDWLPKAQAAVEALRAIPELAALVTVESVRCFGGGCAVELAAGDADKAKGAVAQIDKDESFRSWPGAKYRVGPLPAGPGHFKAEVIFLRPQ